MTNGWHIFHGDRREPHDGINDLPAPPPWRDFSKERQKQRAEAYRIDPRAVQMVNAALYLRRPLLVTGPPGSGKSSLAYVVAQELQLGRVLHWPITSRTTLGDGVYRYDALARLREMKEAEQRGPAAAPAEDIGRYLRLGPLGTALLPGERGRPRALLIDEFDKSDVDLPNDLLHVFEEGEYTIPELERLAKVQEKVKVPDADGKEVEVERGRLVCQKFPFVVLTSNGERDLPPAFLRRCLQLDLPAVEDPGTLAAIVELHLGKDLAETSGPILDEFQRKLTENKVVALDQLLNAVYVVQRGRLADETERKDMIQSLLRELDRT